MSVDTEIEISLGATAAGELAFYADDGALVSVYIGDSSGDFGSADFSLDDLVDDAIEGGMDYQNIYCLAHEFRRLTARLELMAGQMEDVSLSGDIDEI